MVPEPEMSPEAVKETVPVELETLSTTLKEGPERVKSPWEVLVMEEQPGQFCRATVPEALSLTFTEPLGAERVRAAALS